ncbi:MAG: AAA family ATPase [Odoribacter sp.]
MIEKHFEDVVLKTFGFDFSPTQKMAVELFAHFFFAREEEGVFLLKGYAGTGKTSLVAAIVNTLLALEYKVVLLAPTGRAAKIFSGYAGQPAFTIHKKIYRQKAATDGEGMFNLGFNGGADTLFFVDEASMISNVSNDGNFGSGCLLDDLVEFIYNGKNNRLVLVGDVAQLPPVGLDISPALDRNELEAAYHFSVSEVHLTDIMRQAEKSGILYNATQIRNLIGTNALSPALNVTHFPDVFRITGENLLEEIDTCYGKYGEEETIVVCRSNKRSNRFNEGIRRTILYREEDFCSGDRMMIVKNNYFWGANYDKIDFIANGDMATVLRAGKRTDLYGKHFVTTTLRIDGYEEDLTAQVMLDTLTSDYPAMTYEESKDFYRNIEADYVDISSRRKRFEKIRENEYYNALQIKFAYAVTCHKAQGGQWDAVFIDQGWLTEDMQNDEYWRWLYTAITRARQRLYFINFKADFFPPAGEK